MTRAPLPWVPEPFPDELFPSWLNRVAHANFCTHKELIQYLGLRRTPEIAKDIEGVEVSRMLHCLRISQEHFRGMLLENNPTFTVICVAKEDFQSCLECKRARPDVTLRHWRFAWSIQCKVCGNRLQPSSGANDVSGKLERRAKSGAKTLARAYLGNNKWLVRRVQIAVSFANATVLRQRHSSLIGTSQKDRYELLAAIGASKTKPLLKAALVLRDVWRAERVLREVFPYREKLISRVLTVKRILQQSLPKQFQREFENNPGISPGPATEIYSPYFEAALKAIEELGENASNRQLLKCADVYFQRKNSQQLQSQNEIPACG